MVPGETPAVVRNSLSISRLYSVQALFLSPARSSVRVCCLRLQAEKCVVGEWSPWTPCSGECGSGGVKSRRRDVLSQGNLQGHGSDCPPTVEVVACTHDGPCGLSPAEQLSLSLSKTLPDCRDSLRRGLREETAFLDGRCERRRRCRVYVRRVEFVASLHPRLQAKAPSSRERKPRKRRRENPRKRRLCGSCRRRTMYGGSLPEG